MKKFIEILKKYLVIGLVLSSMFFIWLTFSDPTLPTFNFFYIIKLILGILDGAVLALPVIGFVDWFIIKTYKVLFNYFKYANKSGRIIIILLSIVLFIKMVFSWNQ